MVAAISNISVAIVSLLQIIIAFIVPYLALPTFQGRFLGTMGNPNFLAGLLAITFPFILQLELKNVSIVRYIKPVFFAINLIVILCTQSKGALLAFMVVTALYCYKHVTFKRSSLPFILAGALVIITILVTVLPSTIRFSIWDNRTLIWSEGIKAISKRPVLGYGQENFELIYPKERLFPVDSAHNIFIEVAVATGLVGLLTFISILFVAFKNVSFIVKLGLTAFLIRALFNPLSIAEIALFWFYVALY